VTYDPPPGHIIDVPRTAEWLDANGHGQRRAHKAELARGRRLPLWRVEADLVAVWRETAGWSARAAQVPALGPSRVVAELIMTPRRTARLDPANWAPTAKACLDGVVDAGIWPDDSHGWVEGPDMRLSTMRAASDRGEMLRLLIWGRPCCDAAGTHHRHNLTEVTDV
jgi:hypothetical protein